MSEYRYNPSQTSIHWSSFQNRPDDRALPEKALGLIYAMTNDQALELQVLLRDMRARSSIDKRAAMFIGVVTK